MAPAAVDVALRTDPAGAAQYGRDHSRARRPDGRRESDVGRAADSRRIGQAGSNERTVSRLLRQPRPPSSQTWRTFLTNHVATLVSMDFFTVPTLTGRVLFVLVLLAHQRRRIVHVNITEHPTAAWTAQQMIEAFPNDTAPRWLLRDRDAIYGDAFRRRVVGMGIGEVLSSKRARKGQRPNPNPGWSSGDPKHPGQLSIRHRPGSCFAFVVDRVSFRQHAFVQDAGNENASWLTSEKHDVLALLHAAQAEATSSSTFRVASRHNTILS
jgi:hypothetical protein